jgi:hypothetical protein
MFNLACITQLSGCREALIQSRIVISCVEGIT